MDQLRLGKLLMKMGDIPSLPHIANRVIALTNNSGSSADEICTVICQDKVLASKVLKLVNSAYYGLPRKVATIKEAIIILGLQTIRTLAIGASIYKTLGLLKNGKREAEQVWKHGLACAVASKMVAQELAIPQKENAFMAGLLHDIGKIIIGSFFGNEYLQVIELTQTRGCALIDAEQEILGTTHAEVGKMVAAKWNLPDVLVEPIGYHHENAPRCHNQELVFAVRLGDIMAMMAGFCTAGNEDFFIDSGIFRKSNISYDQLYNMSGEIKDIVNLDFI